MEKCLIVAVSDNGAVTYYDILWEPADVVKQALKDYKKAWPGVCPGISEKT